MCFRKPFLLGKAEKTGKCKDSKTSVSLFRFSITMQQDRQKNFYKSIQFPLMFLAIIWTIHLTQVIGGYDFGYYGIYPRRWFGLKGVLTGPLIHADFGHLLSNSAPLLALGGMVFYFYRRVAFRSFFMIYILTGLAVWGLADKGFHIGASGVVYGLVTFVMGNGLFRRNVKSVVLGLIVLFFYSGIFVGVLPNQEGVSWESHLYGAFVGLFTAYFYKEEIEADELEDQPSWANEPAASEAYFLPRDTFEKTRAERLAEAQRARLERGEQ